MSTSSRCDARVLHTDGALFSPSICPTKAARRPPDPRGIRCRLRQDAVRGAEPLGYVLLHIVPEFVGASVASRQQVLQPVGIVVTGVFGPCDPIHHPRQFCSATVFGRREEASSGTFSSRPEHGVQPDSSAALYFCRSETMFAH